MLIQWNCHLQRDQDWTKNADDANNGCRKSEREREGQKKKKRKRTIFKEDAVLQNVSYLIYKNRNERHHNKEEANHWILKISNTE